MNNIQKNMTLTIIIALVAGLFVGWLIWGMRPHRSMNMNGMHRMPNGSMMKNMSGDMHDMMTDMSASLQGKTGDEFDKAFLAEMIVHHEGAVDMAKQVLATSKRPELIKLANDIIAAQTDEIDMMKTWEKEWFK